MALTNLVQTNLVQWLVFNRRMVLFMNLIDQKYRKFGLCINLAGYDLRGLEVSIRLSHLQPSPAY